MKENTMTVVITVLVGAVGMGTGFVIGYLLTTPRLGEYSAASIAERRNSSQYFSESDDLVATGNSSKADTKKPCSQTAREDPDIWNFLRSAEVSACQAADCRVDLPRVYMVYKLDPADRIHIDGRLDERAWQQVAWTENFVDIGGEHLPAPRFESRVKVRWDDKNLYVGAYLQELAVWANKTIHDSTIYQDNSFQVLLDTAQSNHNYKEISINALGIVADIMLTRPYMDDGEPLVFWESDVERAVHIEGPVNDPTAYNQFWTVEMAIPFKQLYAGITRDTDVPSDRETWRANFVRSEWQTNIQGDRYVKKLDTGADWWVWQSPGVANIHLPDKWGLLQFTDAPVNSSHFHAEKKWLTINALLEVYRAQQAYKAVTGQYTDRKDLLHLPPYIMSKTCLRDLDIQLDWGGFRVNARPAGTTLEEGEGHTRTDRLVWFGTNKENFFR